MYALLVGINEYESPTVKSLKGCANDADLMAELLRERFGVAPGNILVLKNSQATHAAIRQAFHDHLIENARAMAASGHTDTPFMFHYSGHGSQAPDESGTEPDGLDETIVPHDSRTADIEDIKDWELGAWLEELTTHSSNVTVVMDCCHSGSATRGITDSAVQTRRCPADTRRQARQRPATVPGRRSVAGASGWRHAGGYALFAGCRDGEESNEHMGWEGRSLGRHGAMSFFLINQLAEMAPEQTMTYREIHRAVRQQVNVTYADQTPCCEGDIDREIFGGLRPRRGKFINVVATGDTSVSIDAGTVHGLTKDTLLHVYAPGTRTRSDDKAPLATLLVTEIGATRSVCTIVEEGIQIPVNSQAVVHRAAPGKSRYRVALSIASAQTKAAVKQRLGQDDLAHYVQLVANGDEPGDFYIEQSNATLSILDATRTALVSAIPCDALDALAADLTHLMRFQDVARLRAPAQAASSAKIEFDVKLLEIVNGEPVTRPLATGDNDELVIEAQTPVVLEVTNRSARDLYFAFLNLSSEWAVQIIYPLHSAHEVLPAGKSFVLGNTAVADEQVKPDLPEGMTQAREIIKVIATSADTDFELLCQGPLPSRTAELPSRSRAASAPFSRLFAHHLHGAQTRAAGAQEEVWSTAQLHFRVRRKQHA